MLPDNARPIKNSGDKFAAFLSRNEMCPDITMVYIFPRIGHNIDFRDCRAQYETLTNGATASARREIKRQE